MGGCCVVNCSLIINVKLSEILGFVPIIKAYLSFPSQFRDLWRECLWVIQLENRLKNVNRTLIKHGSIILPVPFLMNESRLINTLPSKQN